MASDTLARAGDWGLAAPRTSSPAPPPAVNRARTLLRRQSLGRAALILALDFRKGMIEKTPDGCSLLSHALRVVAGVLKDKIVSRARDLVGVVAFGCCATKNKLHMHNLAVIKELEVPDATSIMRLEGLAGILDQEVGNIAKKEVEELVMSEKGQIDQNIELGHLSDGPFAFGNLIWVARSMFAMSRVAAQRNKFDLLGRRIIVFTNDVDPSRGDDEITRLAVTQAKDLADTGAIMDLMLITATEEKVQATKEALNAVEFYPQIFSQQSNDAQGSIYVTSTSKLQDIGAKVRRKIQTKRAHARVVLDFGYGLKIGVKVFSVVRKTSKPVVVPLATSTNLPAERRSSIICSQTAVPLKGDQVRYGYKVGESFAAFTGKEIGIIKTVSSVGMTLYGYMSQKRLRPEENILAPLFVYPEDSRLAGSTALFALLHRKLLERNLVAVVLAQLRAKSEARFAALVPQREAKDNDGVQLKPPGFLMVYLPYKNDLYDQWRVELEKAAETCEHLGGLRTEVELPGSDTGGLSEEDRTVPLGSLAAKEMVRKLMIQDFDIGSYYHPEIQRHYAVLQAVALGHENFGEITDSLQPDDAMMKKVASDMMEKFASMTLGSDFDGAEVAMSHAKGKGSAVEEAEKEKRAAKRKAESDLRAEAALEDLDIERFRDLAAREELETLKVKELKQYCEAHALKTSGRKNALVSRVELHLSQTGKS